MKNLRLFVVLAAGAFPLLAVIVLWAHSFWSTDHFPNRYISTRGEIWLQRFDGRYVHLYSYYQIAIAALFPLTIAFYLVLRRSHPPQPSLCPNCSYDLRAHTPGQSCPECGTPISIDPRSRKQLHSKP